MGVMLPPILLLLRIFLRPFRAWNSASLIHRAAPYVSDDAPSGLRDLIIFSLAHDLTVSHASHASHGLTVSRFSRPHTLLTPLTPLTVSRSHVSHGLTFLFSRVGGKN